MLKVSFPGRLAAGDRLTVPVEIRWRFKLRPGEILLVRLEFEKYLGATEEFFRSYRP